MGRPKGSFKEPSYRLHKATGQGVVTLNGRDHYCGAYAEDASRAKYLRLIAEWRARGGMAAVTTTGITVAELAAGFWTYATKRYVHYHKFIVPLRVLRKLYGDTLVQNFRPLQFKALREEFVMQPAKIKGETWGLKRVNAAAAFIKEVFRWGMECETVPVSVHHAIDGIRPLLPGETTAKTPPPVQHVDDAVVDATLPHILTPTIRLMVQVQRLTGMRSGEVARMRAIDIDMRDPECWVYSPAQHKTQHLGKQRHVAIPPEAQKIIRPLLTTDSHAYLFRPGEGRRAYDAERAAKCVGSPEFRESRRRYQLSRMRAAGYKPTKFKPFYTSSEYAERVRNACDRADAAAHAARPDAPADVRLVPRWHPHQLRHSFATGVAATSGKTAVKVTLGHANEKMSETYIHTDGREEVKATMKRILRAG